MKPDPQERPDFEKAAEKTPSQIMDMNGVKVYGPMRVRIAEAMREYAQQQNAGSRKRIEELEALLLQETGKCMKYTQEIEDLKKRLQNRHICL